MKKRIIPLLSALLTVALLATLALFSVAQSTEPELKIAYCTLEFGQDTHILYAVTSEGVENVEEIEVLVWRKPQTDYTGTPDVTLEFSYEETIGDDKCAVFEFKELGAMNMADNYYACAHAKVDGEDVYSPVNKYSVLQYAYNMLGKAEKTATDDAKLKDLLNSMLDYGSKVQTYANYNTTRLANDKWYYVKVNGGTLDDGFDHGLYLKDDEITVTLNEGESFSYWVDDNGTKLSEEESFETTVSDLLSDDDEKTVITINVEVKASEGLEFKSNGDGTCYVSGIGTCTDTDIVIPKTSPDRDRVTGIGEDAFKNCSDITSVTIPNSVTSIGYQAFEYCRSLASITIPNSVTSIGSWAFCVCTSLESITIPDSVTSIGWDAFSNTAYYNNDANWTDGVLYIGNHLIEAKTSISGAYTIKDGTKFIANYAFDDCTSLKSITIPDSVTSIGYGAFYDCTSLTSVTIGNSVTSIGGSAFTSCTSLTTIDIPDSVTSIGGGAFEDCTSLTSITIPDGVTSIGSNAFEDCTSLTSITIPNSVTSIGEDAFSNTAYYKNDANWTDGVLYIGNHLIEVKTDVSGAYTIKNGTKCIADGAFNYCTDLTSIIIPDSVTSIRGWAFYNCSSIISITIPDSVTSIGKGAFYGCKSLKKVYYKDKADEWLKISISSHGNRNLTDATRYYYSETEPMEDGNWWHYVDGVPTAWNASTVPGDPSTPTYPRELTDDETWGGLWSEVSEGHFSCDSTDCNNNFAVLPVGKFKDGKTKYTISVKYEWDGIKGCGIMFAALDFDENGFIEDRDMYHLILANGYIVHDYRGTDGWAGVWDTRDIDALGIEYGDIVKLTVVINTDTGVVEGYLNDTACGEWTVDLTGFGTWVGVCSKNVGAEYWDLEFAAE